MDAIVIRPPIATPDRGVIMFAQLTGPERAAALAALSGWREAQGRDAITKTFVFRDFAAAFGFMAQAALAAEAMNHHPEWTNVYNRVEVLLTTHDAGGLTTSDIALARRMDEIAATR
jgi:4a-hydroxytetrahydrobiopterin dehydratase